MIWLGSDSTGQPGNRKSPGVRHSMANRARIAAQSCTLGERWLTLHSSLADSSSLLVVVLANVAGRQIHGPPEYFANSRISRGAHDFVCNLALLRKVSSSKLHRCRLYFLLAFVLGQPMRDRDECLQKTPSQRKKAKRCRNAKDSPSLNYL